MIKMNGLPLNVTKFSDNTSQVWKLDEWILNETNFVLIEWDFEHEGEFMHLVQLKYLLEDYAVAASLKLSYLPYGRQDKNISNNKTFALLPFCNLLNSLNFQDVIIVDPHSEIALDLIKNSRADYPTGFLSCVYDFQKIDLVCYPDKGALQKYTKIYDYPYIYGEKVRDQLTGNITSYNLVGDPKDKNILIVDDICDGGATFKILAEDLLAKGASKVVLFVTHGIFSKGVRTLFESGISKVFTKDSEISIRHGSEQL